MDSKEKKVKELKEKGNKGLEAKNYAEAFFHFSHAIKLAPNFASLYSSRSSAFFHLQSYYDAMEDAKTCIKLDPSSSQGYLKKGEIEMATYNFANALKSFQTAFRLEEKKEIKEAILINIRKADIEMKKDLVNNKKIPWLGAIIGVIIGIFIVVSDYVLKPNENLPFMNNPILQTLCVIIFCIIGNNIAKLYQMLVKSSRESMMQKPIDLFSEETKKNE